MPLRPAGPGAWERVPPAPGANDYVARDGLVDLLLRWYETSYPWERIDRPGIEHPDGWSVVRRGADAGRTVLTLVHGVDEAAVELSFRDDGGERSDFRARPLPPEEAHAIALDRDEEARARGLTIYNARHPRP